MRPGQRLLLGDQQLMLDEFTRQILLRGNVPVTVHGYVIHADDGDVRHVVDICDYIDGSPANDADLQEAMAILDGGSRNDSSTGVIRR